MNDEVIIYLLTSRLLPLTEQHRPTTSIRDSTLSRTILSSSFKLLFILFKPASDSQHLVFFGLPRFRFLSRFQVSVYTVMKFDFHNVSHPLPKAFLQIPLHMEYTVFTQPTKIAYFVSKINYQYSYISDDGCSVSPSFSSLRQNCPDVRCEDSDFDNS